MDARRRVSAQLTGLVVLALLTGLLPQVVYGQAGSGITGVARDTTGAVLPGVTVEAESPALIDRVRTATTDTDGMFRVVDLRPGTYTVRFVLPGFSTLVRTGVELPAAFTATVNADLSVGGLEETVTVTGAAPVVDVRSATSSQVLRQDLLESIPSVRSPQGLVALTPGMVATGVTSVGGGREELDTATNGSQIAETVFQVDGVSTARAGVVGGGATTFRISQSYVEQINIVTAGGTAEQQFGGTVVNVIPRQGGNTFSGLFYTEFTNDALQGTNLTDELRNVHGFTRDGVSGNVKSWEISPAFGGPIVRNRLWFFGSYRNAGTIQTRAGIYENKTPLGWVYTPDTSRPAVIKITDESRALRLTLQAQAQHQIVFFADFQPHIVHQRNYQFNVSPEATTYTPMLPNALKTVNWRSPITNRLLLEATFAHNSQNIDIQRPPIGARDFSVISAFDATTGMLFRQTSSLIGGAGNYGHWDNRLTRYSASASYVSGSHAAKVGMQLARGSERRSDNVNGNVAYSLRNGVPFSIRQYADPLHWKSIVDRDMALYVQDQWTRGRLTLTAGLRADHFHASTAAQELPAGQFVGARSFAAQHGAVVFNDVSPRMAAAFDVSGDGKTAVKFTHNRYVAGQGASGLIGQINPVVRTVQFAARNWTDGNADYVPDCDLTSFAANGECGEIQNANFGRDNPAANVFDDNMLKDNRGYNWETSAIVQRQLADGMSVTVGYFRRAYGNFTTTDNLSVEPHHYDEYCIVAPVDSRLPSDVTGARICGLYDIQGAFRPAVNPARNLNTVLDDDLLEKYGNGKREQVYDGFNITQEMRFPNGATISGGMQVARTRNNTCFIVDSPNAMRQCDVRPPFQPNASLIGFYPLPGEIVVSATYRNYPGPQITASYNVTSAQIAQWNNGRPLSAGGTVDVPLVQPGTMYGARQHQLDVRFSKRHRIGGVRVSGNVDVNNLLNSTGIVNVNTTFGPSWQRPLLLQGSRFVRVSGQVDFK